MLCVVRCGVLAATRCYVLCVGRCLLYCVVLGWVALHRDALNCVVVMCACGGVAVVVRNEPRRWSARATRCASSPT